MPFKLTAIYCLLFPFFLFGQDSLDFKLLEASYEGDTNLVKSLLNSGASANATAFDSTTALMYASGNNHAGIVELLLNAGAEPEKGSNVQPAPLITAASNNYFRVTQLLLEYGAQTDIRDTQGRTSLMYAAGMNAIEIVWLLLDAGASAAVADIQGRQAVHYAAEAGAYECLAILLEQGAEACPQDASGASPAHLAASYDDIAILDLLSQHACPLSQIDRHGLNPAAHAVIHNSASALLYLVDHIQATKEYWELPALLSLKTGQDKLYKTLKDSTNIRINKAVGYGVEADLLMAFNAKDHYAQMRGRWLEAHTNISAGVTYGRRIKPVRVLREMDGRLFQFREKRNFLFINLHKIIYVPLNYKLVLDIRPGINYGISWANYRGSNLNIDSKWIWQAESQFALRWNHFAIFTGLSYSGLNQKEISELYVNTGLSFRFNRINFKQLSHIL